MPTLSQIRFALFWFASLSVALIAYRFLAVGIEAAFGFMIYHFEERPLAFLLHIGLAPVALALMPLQLMPRLRARRPRLHRWTGRAYAVAVGLSGTAGLVLALGTEAGPEAGAGFASLAVLWLATTALGIGFAMRGDTVRHREWMLRSAALTFAGAALRLELVPLVLAGLEFDTAYTTVAWLSWVPNLLVAEWLLLGRPRPSAPRLVPA